MTAAPDYRTFLEAKFKFESFNGFDIDPSSVNPRLKDHIRAIVPWGLKGGRRAFFLNFGLAKTSLQIELMRLIGQHTGLPTLIVLPLGVRAEFMRDAAKLFRGKFAVRLRFIRGPGEIEEGPHPTYLTNYETVRDGKLDPSLFVAASLDEAAVLRSYGSKTYQEFLPLFAGVRYRFVATATPAPNRLKEIIHYAGFLGVMDTGQALTRFFQRNSEKANDLTLYPHRETEFWLWCHSWAVFLGRPSDLGYSDEGYELPPMQVRWHEVPSNHAAAGHDRDGQGLLLSNPAIGVQAAAAEKRDTIGVRVEKLTEIILGYRQEGLHEGLSREEQGHPQREAAGARQAPLPGQQGDLSSKGGPLEGGKSPARCSARPGLPGQEPGEAQKGERGLVREQQGPGSGYSQAREDEPDVRPDLAAVSGAAGAAGVRVRDLPADAHAAARGSHSRNEAGEGAALPTLQHSARPVRGQHGQFGECNRVSEPSQADQVDQVVVWCDLNDEQRAIERALDDAGLSYSSLYGSQSIEEREGHLATWRDRHTTVFLSKTSMYGAGLNMQQAHRMIFAGVHHKFYEVIQGIHRVYRFGQREPVRIDIIHSEAERPIVEDLKAKWREHDAMQARMAEIIRTYGLDHGAAVDRLRRSIGVDRREVSGERYRIAHNDCVEETRRMETASVAQIVTSIPFGNQYEYVAAYEDFGHCDDNAKFWQQMDYLTPELFRILWPGRYLCVHMKDRILFGNVTGEGVPTVSPFHAEGIFHYIRHGFQFMGMITIVTDVVFENNQTYRLGYTEMLKDGSTKGVGSPEYILLMRKPQSDKSRGYADVPIVKDPAQYSLARWQVDAHAFWRSSGNRLLTAEELIAIGPKKLAAYFPKWTLHAGTYDYEKHIALGEEIERRRPGALPRTFMGLAPGSHDPAVWHDVNRLQTLNSEQSLGGREKHVCPLQLDVVERLIERYSNTGEVIFDPFLGIGSVAYQAIRSGRRGMGSELHGQYFDDAARYCRGAEAEIAAPSLFDLADLRGSTTDEAA